MAAPVVVAVLFDERAIASDLQRLPVGATTALATLRHDLARDGGLRTTRLKRCSAHGRDGTRPSCET